MWKWSIIRPMKNIDHRTPDSKGNIVPSADVIKMQGNVQEIDFKEPEDYSIESPEVTIDGCEYHLFEGGSLSYVTPKLLAQVVGRLRAQQ